MTYIVAIPVTVYREEKLKKNVCHDLGNGSSLDVRVEAENARDALSMARLAVEVLIHKGQL